MQCHDAQAEMVGLVQGTLAGPISRAIEDHVRGCTTCRAELEQLRCGWNALAAMPPVPALRSEVRETVLRAVRPELQAVRTPRGPRVATALGGFVAALATVALVVVPDPDCRSPFAIACCAMLWVVVYGVGFSLLAARRRGKIDAVAGRGLLAAAGGLLLVRACPGESAELISIPFLSRLSERASESSAIAFLFGGLLGAVPIAFAVLALRSSRATVSGNVTTAGIYLAVLAPALYLASSYLALTGLLALVGGAVAGAMAPVLLEVAIRRPRTAT